MFQKTIICRIVELRLRGEVGEQHRRADNAARAGQDSDLLNNFDYRKRNVLRTKCVNALLQKQFGSAGYDTAFERCGAEL
jgi:hypothetical protein